MKLKGLFFSAFLISVISISLNSQTVYISHQKGFYHTASCTLDDLIKSPFSVEVALKVGLIPCNYCTGQTTKQSSVEPYVLQNATSLKPTLHKELNYSRYPWPKDEMALAIRCTWSGKQGFSCIKMTTHKNGRCDEHSLNPKF